MSEPFKIYTKGGDAGQTSLIGGTRVPKDHLRIEAYGTLDELNSFIGLLRDQPEAAGVRAELVRIQEQIFTAESWLAVDPGGKPRALPQLREEEVVVLEQAIDRMNDRLPPLTRFLLPGGHAVVSLAHVARTVCRRAERTTITLGREHPVDPVILRYLNRLSDYFFVLARFLGQETNAGESPWAPEY
ncbi:MAG TPA: cob(I)yrinic acid a,c-diamide adenosyltransferase [Bacteroidales bacterium]|nr:cob(I)yrinic acid a,c-diamide adenosyltransferase [Bacteroidales bacterium]